jgi:hypothetical protein
MRKYILSTLGVTALTLSSTAAFAQTAYPGFGAEQEWSSVAFDGNVTNLVADVTGDGKADAVGISTNSIWVMPSTGTSFGPPMQWSSIAFDGAVANVLGDVDGDGKADMIGFNATNVWVLPSTGSFFAGKQQWSSASFDGTVTNLVADVNGDGKVDAVGFNPNNIWVMPSTGSEFGPNQQWSGIAFDGTVANVLGDVNGDGKADAVGFNSTGTWVMLSSSFTPSGTLNVPLDPQLESNWCWAAGGEMIMSYLGTTVQQCAQANELFGLTTCCTNPSSSGCNQGGFPQWGTWNFSATIASSALSFAQLQAEFAANRPVGFAWRWDSGGGHYMVATGASTDADNVQYVSFNDPWAPNVGDQVTLTYEEWTGSSIGTDPTSGLGGYTFWRDDYGISNNN